MYTVTGRDGTLSGNSKRRHHLRKKPKDHAAHHPALLQDQPRRPLLTMTRSLLKAGNRAGIWARRDEAHRAPSELWLQHHFLRHAHQLIYTLRMRRTGDHRDLNTLKGN